MSNTTVDCLNVGSSSAGAGLRSSRGPFIGPYLVSVGLACTFMFDVSDRVFRAVSVFFLLSDEFFFKLGHVCVKNYGRYPTRDLLPVKNYDPYVPATLVGSGQIGFFFERVGSGWSGWVTHDQVYTTVIKRRRTDKTYDFLEKSS
jgi:hypothetical protein